MASPSDLSPRQRQVLDFVASFVADEGYLPTTRVIAAACGLQSPTSVRRALQTLERAGLIRRDPDHRRLATITRADGLDGASDLDGTSDPDEELVLCELILVEMEAAIETAKRGLAWAPDLDTQELVHRESLARIRLWHVYDDVRTRLALHAGSRAPRVDEILAEHRRLVDERLELVTSWDTYCLSTLVLGGAVGEFLTEPLSFTHVHLRPAYAAELALLDPNRRPDLCAVRDRLHAGEPTLTEFTARYLEVLRVTFTVLAASAPALASTQLQAVATRSLEHTLGSAGVA